MTGGIRCGYKKIHPSHRVVTTVKRAAVILERPRSFRSLASATCRHSVLLKCREALFFKLARLLARATSFHPKFDGADVGVRVFRNAVGLFCLMAKPANRNRTRSSFTPSPYNLLYLFTSRMPLSAHFAVDRKCRSSKRIVVEFGLTLGLSFVNSLTIASILRTEGKPFETPDPAVRCPFWCGNARAKYRCRSLRHA